MDATVLAPGLDIDRFLEACRGQRIIPRIDDVREMALRAQILLLRHTESTIELDVSLAWLGFEEEAIGRARHVAIATHRLQAGVVGICRPALLSPTNTRL